MCWTAKTLIALCVGYLPANGSTVKVRKYCVYSFAKETREAAVACAREHDVTWKIR